VTSIDEGWDGPGTLIGVPLPHLSVRVLDEHQRPVPSGEVGELFIAGGGLSAGYLNRDELNSHRFPVLQDADGQSVRYFRSGDLAHWDPDQRSLVCHGRSDDQVKLHGFRIELGEVENTLRAGPDVADAAVAIVPGADGPILTAYLVSLREDPEQVDRVRRHVLSRLPRYMVPERFRFIPAMPLTPTGKTDRAKLVD
jgi:novobiocin biosynthesis protein NovH